MTGRVYCMVSCWTASYDSTFSSLPAISAISILVFPRTFCEHCESFCYPRVRKCFFFFFALFQTAKGYTNSFSIDLVERELKTKFGILEIFCSQDNRR